MPASARDVNTVSSPEERARLGHFPRLENEADHPTRWVFPDYLDNPRCKWLAVLKELYTHPVTFPASLSPEAGIFLHGMVRNLRPRLIVEVGSFVSVSTHWMTSALLENGVEPTPFGRVHCFDRFAPIQKDAWRDAEMLDDVRGFVERNLADSGLDEYVRLHDGDSPASVLMMQDELKSAGGVDFAFIDGDHTVPGVTTDLSAVEPVLNTGGYILLHVIYPDQCGHDGPRYVLDHINDLVQGTYEQIELYLGPLNYGFGLLRRLA